mgnify:CR=1 FL=1
MNKFVALFHRTVLKRNSRLQVEKGSPAGEGTVPQGIARPGQTLLELIELLTYHLQLLYMRKKITREHITPSSAFFHPNDPGAEVLKKVRPAKETSKASV